MKKKMSFWELFEVICPHGTLKTKKEVRIAGIQMQTGVMFGNGVSFCGIHLFDHVGRYLEVEKKKNVYVITGIF